MIIDNPSKYLKAVDFEGNSEMLVKILNEGEKVESAFKNKDGSIKYKYQFNVELPSGFTKIVSFNSKSLSWMLEKYGKDSKKWIGKQVACYVLKDQMVAGKMHDVIYIGFNPKSGEPTPEEEEETEEVPLDEGPDGA